MAIAQVNNQLLDVWTSILSGFENVKLHNVAKSPSTYRSEYWFSIYITTKKGKLKPSKISFSNYKNQLNVNFSDQSTKEMLFIHSEMIDKIVENIVFLDPSFTMVSTFSEIKYPYTYRSKEARNTKRPSGVKKADILGKKDEILTFFEVLKTKDLPKKEYHYDERRVFQVGGPGSKHLVEFFLELGIAKEIGKWDPYHTIRFNPEHYKGSLFEVMEEWENFVRKEIGLEKCYVHKWYMD